MKKIETEITIRTSTKVVWDKLMDFESYPYWNPLIKSISGEKKPGGKLRVFIKPPGHSGMVFKPKIKTLVEEKEFRWMGRMIIPGIFDGEHYFKMEEIRLGEVRFTQGEKFSGLLVGAFSKTLAKTIEGFELMNMALKNECEIDPRKADKG